MQQETVLLEVINKYIQGSDKYRLLADILDIINAPKQIQKNKWLDLDDFKSYVTNNGETQAWFYHDFGETGIFNIQDNQLICDNPNYFKYFVTEFLIK